MPDLDSASLVARQEAVQPSLWDRLVDDLPGLLAERGDLHRDLTAILGDAAQVDALVAGGMRAIEARDDLDEATRRLAHRLAAVSVRQRRLEEGGVVVTPDVLREAVRRDIEMLFNVERLEAEFLLTDREHRDRETPAEMLADYPNVRSSVVNYGVPSFSGRSGSDFDKDGLAAEIKKVLAIYEPRLKRDSIRVKVQTGDKTGLRIDIDGILMLSPVPERLRLSTTIDLDSGAASTALDTV
ncbi:type VI secretion system baseplate subunit TssE [Jannaschia seohaensis]|uniref:Type VI secretion system protein ImpF n=1 Tax=Jannaschia seohaensis TaxID=475081 RepID=A0A2Y9AXH2_9RHOB|nr:type VI secretion system baseplate subunit TssE [Jannaschia seohaensis]PWJ16559.1 type VI secretion system protein ImpF [Jannaschia seohaensis]SSA48796.1 type VI secretion system protein ImpF [Jannaschia seohaensis]